MNDEKTPESWGELVLGTLDDWAEDLATGVLKDYKPFGDKDLLDEHSNFMRGVDPLARHAFQVFVHLAHLKDALDEGNAERAAYESMAVTWEFREIGRIQLNIQAVGWGVDKDYELDDLRERLKIQEIEMHEIVYSAERQQMGLAAFNDFQKRRKESRVPEARELRNHGYTHAAIAEAMHVSEKTVSRYLKEEK